MNLPNRLAALAALCFLVCQVFSRNISEVDSPACAITCYQTLCDVSTLGNEYRGCGCGDTSDEDLNDCFAEACLLNTDYNTAFRLLQDDCGDERTIDTYDVDYITTAIVTFAVQTLFFVPRITTRLLGLSPWGRDDTSCVVAYILLVPYFVISVLMGHYGFYVIWWTLDWWKAVIFIKLNFARTILYCIILPACKASIIFLYQRIFDTTNNTLRWVLWGTHTINILLAVAYFLAEIFVYRPIACNWMIDDPDGICVKYDAYDGSGANAAVNAALDIWLVIIPAVVIWKLRMKISQKLSVIAIFATGIVTSLTALLRFVVWRVQNPRDPNSNAYTYQYAIWATAYSYEAEMTCCFVICCLPAVRQLFRERISPFISSQKTSIVSRLRSKVRVEEKTSSAQQSPLERTRDSVEMEGSWQVDSYLDTSGPEYAWMRTGNHQNMVSAGRSPDKKVSGVHSVEQT